jgi:hypothetical protein
VRLFLITAACAAALALPVLADPTAPAAPSTGDTPAAAPTATAAAPASTPAKAEPDVVCKMKQVTGSRFGVKVCTTKAQRDDQAAQARDLLAQRPDANRPPGS